MDVLSVQKQRDKGRSSVGSEQGAEGWANLEGSPGSASSCCVALGKSLNLSGHGPSAMSKRITSIPRTVIASEEQMLVAAAVSY